MKRGSNTSYEAIDPTSRPIAFDFMAGASGTDTKPRASLPDRLFLALKPDPEAALTIRDTAQKIGGQLNQPVRCIEANRLHLSLLSFGDDAELPRPLIERVRALAAKIEISALEIVFDCASHFGGGAFVLRKNKSVNGIVKLRRDLLDTFSTIPIVKCINSRNFEPHLTVFYSAGPCAT